jgi:predicted CoA-binding protein
MKQKIAVIGASRDRAKYGNKCVRAFATEGWEVYPVNPNADEVEGHRAYPTIRSVPGELQRISVYLPPEVTARAIPEIADKGAWEVWFNPGSADAEVLAKASEYGLAVRDGCSIRDIGRAPGDFPSS